MTFIKTTEQTSEYDHLEEMSLETLLRCINNEDKKVALAVEESLPAIKLLTSQVIHKLKQGGRLFYIGAGTSGRLGILDASECVPTFGVAPNLVTAVIAGGDSAIRNAVEFAEDDLKRGWIDLKNHQISHRDIAIGIAASGTTPYVVEAIKMCRKNHIATGSIACNRNSPLSNIAQFSIEIVVGPEFITGSSRMKAGTAQKLVLNMITTSTMIQLGHVKGNQMVDMPLSNNKLLDRGINMVMTALNTSKENAQALLKTYKSVRLAIKNRICDKELPRDK